MWTTLEVRRAIEMHSAGISYVRIADDLGRSRGSVYTMFRDLKRRNSRVQRIVRQPEPEMEPVPFDEAEGSRRLRTATLKALLRWANDNAVTIDDAARFLLSGAAA
jgi:IS30 family transposase